ncbi:MAG: BrnA antitoxin family protein [Pseudomonadota bacterium]|nr:BrnA antitoxin family protein [Pseudomonadota bacterium]
MPKRKPLIDKNGEVRELSAADIKRMRPAKEALPRSLRLKLGVRGPQRAPKKERITIRLSPEVVERFRATGEGWQTRLDAALQDWLKSHSPA